MHQRTAELPRRGARVRILSVVTPDGTGPVGEEGIVHRVAVAHSPVGTLHGFVVRTEDTLVATAGLDSIELLEQAPAARPRALVEAVTAFVRRRAEAGGPTRQRNGTARQPAT